MEVAQAEQPQTLNVCPQDFALLVNAHAAAIGLDVEFAQRRVTAGKHATVYEFRLVDEVDIDVTAVAVGATAKTHARIVTLLIGAHEGTAAAGICALAAILAALASGVDQTEQAATLKRIIDIFADKKIGVLDHHQLLGTLAIDMTAADGKIQISITRRGS